MRLDLSAFLLEAAFELPLASALLTIAIRARAAPPFLQIFNPSAVFILIFRLHVVYS
jgi:hypothetical protein